MSTLQYQPDIGALSELMRGRTARRVLLLGTSQPLAIDAEEVRWADSPAPILANGLYVFGGATADVLLVARGLQPVPAQSAPIDVAGDDHPLIHAYGWLDHFWPDATPLGTAPRFAIGDYALIAGSSRIARIEEVLRVNGANAYRVSIEGVNQTITEDGLAALALDANDASSWLKSPAASADELAVSITHTKLTNPLTDTIYSYLSSKTVFRPYQFRPVLQLLRSPHGRILVADEVGLGKTIEAGLIWTELEARSSQLNRVLVVCPAMLVPKWRSEMRRRFDRDLVELDSSRLKELVEVVRAGEDEKQLHGVVSLERLRSSTVLAELTELQPRFDLVIVDEAHYLRNHTTMSYELGQSLSDWAEVLVFLSATPLNLGNDDLFNLLHLLVEDEFSDREIFPRQVEPNRHLNQVAASLLARRRHPRELLPALRAVASCQLGGPVVARAEYAELEDLLDQDGPLEGSDLARAKRLLADLNTLSGVLTRTRKVDVPDAKAVREPFDIPVSWEPHEAELYRAVLAWARQRAAVRGGIPGFSTQMPLRQAASCLPAVRASLLERMAEDDFDDYLDGSEPADDDVMTADQILAACDGLGDTDTKFDAFAAHLQEALALGSGQALLFSFFRRTLGYLERRINTELGIRARVMHGGIPVQERQVIMDDFRAGKYEVLLTSEVGSEGLDFEFCNVIINYDLPWNPMKVEQRIGRLDRFGQTSEKIFICNFRVPGTIETDIFERLYDRINVFQESIGELEPILRDEFGELTRVALDPNLSDEQRQVRLTQIEVAVEERRNQLDDLEDARSLLSGIDQLLIDGFEEETTSKGRFLGPRELELLLRTYFADVSRAKLVPARGMPGRFDLIGDEHLAELVARHGRGTTGSIYRLPQLVMALRDGDPIPVTFSNEDASKSGLELISLRHPVVRAAAAHLGGRPMGLKRFGAVQVPGNGKASSRHLVVLHLAETTGLRPSLELWPLAIDLDTGEINHEIGDAFLAAVSAGTLEDGVSSSPAELEAALARVGEHALEVQVQVEAERRRSNEVLVDSRIATQRASYAGKVGRAQETLDRVVRDRRGESVQRLHRSRIANIEHRLAETVEKLEASRGLALTLRPIALAEVSTVTADS